MQTDLNRNKSAESSILKGTVIILLMGILAKLMAFVNESLLAAYLGTTYKSDAYCTISSVHMVIYPMMNIGIWKVFLPLYKSHIAKNELEAAETLANKSISFFTLVSTVVTILLILLAPLVVTIVAPAFSGETRELTIKLVRLSSPMYILLIAVGVYASMLQCHGRFFGSQIREVISHIPTIITAIFLYSRLGIEAMAIALIVSGLLRFVVQLPFVNWGYRFKPDLKFKTKEFGLMLKRMPSALISAGVLQLNSLVDKAMASGLPEGTISSLNYGYKLVNAFGGLISSSIATAMYPQMIELISLKKKDELSRLLVRIISLFALITIPITLACILFRVEITSAVYERGAFRASSTQITANIFALYCISLFSEACNTVLSNIFYGNGNTRTPMFISLFSPGMNIVFNFIFMHFWGVNGLVLSTSLVSGITFCVMFISSRKYVKLNVRELIVTGLKIAICAAIACFIPRVVFWIYPTNKHMLLIGSAAIGIPIYYLMTRIFKIKELDDLTQMLKKKFKKA